MGVIKHLDKEGIPPTLDEIATNFQYKSINTVRSHLRLIEKKGYIRVYPGKSRGIQVFKSTNDMMPQQRFGQIPIKGRLMHEQIKVS